MRDLVARTSSAENVDQFARWFDQTMSERHPFIEWGTQRSRKWRRNYVGDASLTRESLDLLYELFPDDRYYTAIETFGRRRSVTHAYAAPPQPREDGRTYAEHLSAAEMFEKGPSNLWTALWGYKRRSGELWDLFSPDSEYDGAWGQAANFDDVVTDMEMRLHGKLDCDVPVTPEELTRTVVVYRLQASACNAQPHHGIRAYLCLRLALADLHPWLRTLGIFDDLSRYIVGLEQQRVATDGGYRRAVHDQYSAYGTFSIGMFVENPFLYLYEWMPQLAHRYAPLARYSAYDNISE